MAQLAGVNIEKLQGGLGRRAAGTDNHLGMVLTQMSATDIHSDVNNDGKGVVLKSVYDAEQLGFNESFDDNNSLNYYDQIVEFFRLAPEATLYVLSADGTGAIPDFINANPDLKGYGVDNKSATLDTQDIKAHQTIINDLAGVNRLIDFAVVCLSGLDDAPSDDLFGLECPNVSVSIACEKDDKNASIGSVLGMIGVRGVSENIGSVDIDHKPLAKRGSRDYPLTDSVLDRWTSSFLADGTSVNTLDNAALQDLIDKGYIIAVGYAGYPGFFLNNSYTCTERSSDYAFIENNRVWNKASRIARQTLLPRVKSQVKKDPQTGYIAPTTASYWKTLIEKAVEKMQSDEEISGYKVDIDPKQVVNSTEPVKVKLSIVANGIVHEFEVAVGLTNKIE